jgi:hypothetical protein
VAVALPVLWEFPAQSFLLVKQTKDCSDKAKNICNIEAIKLK